MTLISCPRAIALAPAPRPPTSERARSPLLCRLPQGHLCGHRRQLRPPFSLRCLLLCYFESNLVLIPSRTSVLGRVVEAKEAGTS
jgi:hypothetical protein